MKIKTRYGTVDATTIPLTGRMQGGFYHPYIPLVVTSVAYAKFKIIVGSPAD